MDKLCRSDDKQLDRYIFEIFCCRSKEQVFRDEMVMMTMNLPDINFGQSHQVINQFTRQIEDIAIQQVMPAV